MEDFNFPKSKRGKNIQTSVLVSKEFYVLAKQYNIQFSDALRTGLSLMFADKGIADYDNNLNLYRRMRMFQQELEKVSKEFEDFKAKQNINDKIVNEFS